jgi:hypothetical protein
MDDVYKYESKWIHKLEKEIHWRAYWLQQKLLESELNENDTILEIGKGTGFCSNYLKSKGYKVTTFDIDGNKNPDIVGNFVDYEFPEKYDHVIAFEVLEHIPFNDLGKVFKRIKSCIQKSLIISIPEGSITLLLVDIRVPIIKHVRFGIRVQQRFLPSFLRLKLPKYHHWELNYNNECSLNNLRVLFNQEGLKIEKHIRSHFNNHNFFIIKQR